MLGNFGKNYGFRTKIIVIVKYVYFFFSKQEIACLIFWTSNNLWVRPVQLLSYLTWEEPVEETLLMTILNIFGKLPIQAWYCKNGGCGFNSHSTGTQPTMPRHFGEKWRTEVYLWERSNLNIRFLGSSRIFFHKEWMKREGKKTSRVPMYRKHKISSGRVTSNIYCSCWISSGIAASGYVMRMLLVKREMKDVRTKC